MVLIFKTVTIKKMAMMMMLVKTSRTLSSLSSSVFTSSIDSPDIGSFCVRYGFIFYFSNMLFFSILEKYPVQSCGNCDITTLESVTFSSLLCNPNSSSTPIRVLTQSYHHQCQRHYHRHHEQHDFLLHNLHHHIITIKVITIKIEKWPELSFHFPETCWKAPEIHSGIGSIPHTARRDGPGNNNNNNDNKDNNNTAH